MIGRLSPSSFCWSRKSLIQAPLRFEGAREIIADEQRDLAPVVGCTVPGARVWMIEPARRSARRSCRPNSRFAVWNAASIMPVELQIGLDLALIEIELGLAPLLGVIAPVPGRELEIAALAGDDRLQRRLLPLRAQSAPAPTPTAADRARPRASSPSCRRGGNGRSSHSREGARARRAASPSRRRWRDCRSRPPFSPRAVQARKAFSRRSRRAENCRNGSMLERDSVIAIFAGMAALGGRRAPPP